ncbi:hypothetical protein H0O02_03635 [Candidatus Micrarchaeota archaeon]|nr:hypothetical protein [Candidatus Micrarchaeota archaeon]
MAIKSGGFIEFVKSVIGSAKKGGLKGKDLKKLEHLLRKTGKRNRILAQGILTALALGGAGRKDIGRFSELLGAANQRIAEDREPFTPKQQEELNGIFSRAFISRKTAKWFSMQLDELVAEEINSFIYGERQLMEKVPEKKSVRFEAEMPSVKRKEEKVKL